jgi:hypothetical protein
MTAGNQSTTMSTSERCSLCGRRAVSSGVCSACGESHREARREIMVTASPPSGAFIPVGALLMPDVGKAESVAVAQPKTIGIGPITRGRIIGSLSPCAVRGRVLVVRQGPDEPMDFDPWRWIAIPVWGLVLLTLPLTVAIGVWRSAGFLPALAVSVCSLLVLRFLFSNRLLQSWQFTAALNGRYIVERMPLVLIRLRQEDDHEVQLRLKGRLSGGGVMEGDRISASGRWRGGVFHVDEISCERTGATIVPRQPSALGLAIAGSCVLASIGFWLCFAGVPWVMEQTHTLRTSIENRVQDARSYRFER